MRKALFSLGFGITLFVCAIPIARFPQAEIVNEWVHAKLYLPDSEQGYYQGTRFDWSGVIYSLEYQGHSYFGQWFNKYDPKLHDAISGPVEEFTPLGYDEAKSGEAFVKIGVGALLKPDEPQYHFSNVYKIINPGKWDINKRKDQIEFVHELSTIDGYSYIYSKTVRLLKGKPVLVLEHTLKNTGQRPIKTSVYNHNFFVIDKQPTGPDIVIKFPFDVQAKGLGIGDIAQVQNKQLTYLRELATDEHIYSDGLQGFKNIAKDYDIRIENHKTGAGVRITSDQPMSKLVFWASSTTSCPEPYLNLYAAQGQEVTWKIKYEFYTFSTDATK